MTIKDSDKPSPEIIKLFSCSTELNMKFQLLIIKLKCLNIEIFLAFKLSEAVFILLIIVKMPTIEPFKHL